MCSLYPIFVDLSDRLILVIGGGQVALRKVERLLECGAKIKLISPEITEDLLELANQGRIKVLRRSYEAGDLKGSWLVIGACDVEDVNQRVFEEACKQKVFCNIVDAPLMCSFHVPALVKRDQLQIAISTAGASPALAKYIRKQLEEIFESYYEDFLIAMRELREHIKVKYPGDQPRRAVILEDFVHSEAMELLRVGKKDKFQQLLEQWKNR